MRILECDKEAMSSTKYKSILFFTNAKAIGPCWAGQDNLRLWHRIPHYLHHITGQYLRPVCPAIPGIPGIRCDFVQHY